MLLSNLTFQPCPHHPKCPGFAVDVYCGPCCGAQEHTHHVECLAPQTSSIFQFTAPWHRWPAGLPAAVMLADAEVKQTQRLVWHVSTHVRISLLWAATLFFFLKDVGSSPPPNTTSGLPPLCQWSNDEPWLNYNNRKRGGGGGGC